MAVIQPIAYIYSGFKEKFGIPRQSGRVPSLRSKIIFEPEYRRAEALRGLEDFSHLWLIWEFTEAHSEGFRPTVRPPRLGGNRRVGVFASRSPFRPNRLGLSAVRLLEIDYKDPQGPVLTVGGADLLDGTPIYDIKPYVPMADAISDATGGYTDQTSLHRLRVEYVPGCKLPSELQETVTGILAEDPRPGYENDPETEYGLSYRGYNIRFRAKADCITVTKICASDQPSVQEHTVDQNSGSCRK